MENVLSRSNMCHLAHPQQGKLNRPDMHRFTYGISPEFFYLLFLSIPLLAARIASDSAHPATILLCLAVTLLNDLFQAFLRSMK